MPNDAANSARNFFKCMSLSAVILAIRAPIIMGVSFETVKAIWFTFLFILIASPIIGLMGMFTIDGYGKIKELINKRNRDDGQLV